MVTVIVILLLKDSKKQTVFYHSPMRHTMAPKEGDNINV